MTAGEEGKALDHKFAGSSECRPDNEVPRLGAQPRVPGGASHWL